MAFRDLRRKLQLLPEKESRESLGRATHGVLSLLGEDGYPYGVPLSHVLVGDTLYFHGARAGHKLDAIRACNKACYTVVLQDKVVPEEFTTYFRSVIAFGQIQILEKEEEIIAALEHLGERFSPGLDEKRDEEIKKSLANITMLAFKIEHLTGKEAIELARLREQQGKEN